MYFTRIAIALAFVGLGVAGLSISAFAGQDRAQLAAHQDNAASAQSHVDLQWTSRAIDSHGSTSIDADAASNRIWGNELASFRGERSPSLEGGHTSQRDVFTDGAMSVAGMDRTGVSSPPGHGPDSYSDDTRASDVFSQA
jgi:hypothetical protein